MKQFIINTDGTYSVFAETKTEACNLLIARLTEYNFDIYEAEDAEEDNSFTRLSKEKQLELVIQNGLAIQFITNPSKKVQLEAFKQNAFVIKWMTNPTKENQLEAVKQYPEILNEINRYIENPCQEVLDMLMIKDIIE